MLQNVNAQASWRSRNMLTSPFRRSSPRREALSKRLSRPIKAWLESSQFWHHSRARINTGPQVDENPVTSLRHRQNHSFLFDLTNGLTNCGEICLTVCPNAASLRAI
jgi:hypothetical protein